MTELEKYTTAVAIRKSIDRTSGVKVNVAVLLELEDQDVPRMLEIIRLQAEALDTVITHGEEEGRETEDDFVEVLKAQIKVEELAAQGSKARFGEYVPPPQNGNGNGKHG